MQEKFNLEIQKRLNNELWGAQIAAHVIQVGEVKALSSESAIKKFKLYSLGSIAALFVAVIGFSTTFYYNDYFSIPDTETNIANSPAENYHKQRQLERNNNSILYDNLDNIVEASINMRTW
ncbi:MAG: hypothetical protein ABUK01_08295 [Leptospirales bacterium]